MRIVWKTGVHVSFGSLRASAAIRRVASASMAPLFPRATPIWMPWSYLAGTVADVGTSLPAAIAIGAVAGALMGTSVAAATGVVLRRLAPL